MDIKSIINEALFTDRDLPDEIPTITIQDKIVATKGNFITINGMPKSYKTTIMNFFIYSAISQTEIFGIKLHLEKSESIVLVDTEQGVFDFNKQFKRLKHLLKTKTAPEQMKSYLFRKNEPHEILKAIELILIEQKPKFLFIDNLTELVINPNDMIEAKTVIQFLKRITAEHDTTIVCLLHLGKTSFNTLGNLGSYADRGAQASIKLKYDIDNDIISVEPSLMRSDRLFKTINLRYNNDIHNFETLEIEPVDKKKKSFEIANQSFEGLKSTVSLIFENEPGLIYSDLVESLKPVFGVGNNIVKQKIIPHLMRINLIKNLDGLYKLTN